MPALRIYEIIIVIGVKQLWRVRVRVGVFTAEAQRRRGNVKIVRKFLRFSVWVHSALSAGKKSRYAS